MKRFLPAFRAADLRLLAAVAACIALFVATPTSDDSGCSSKIGALNVANNGDRVFIFSIAGPEDLATPVEANTVVRLAMKEGHYAWVARTLEAEGFSFNSGSVKISTDREASIGLAFK
jgi:hypothetical protein